MVSACISHLSAQLLLPHNVDVPRRKEKVVVLIKDSLPV